MSKKLDDLITINRNEWIVYAYQILQLECEDIADKTMLAISTIKTYIRKFAHLLDKAKLIFDEIYFVKKERKKYSDMIVSNVDTLDNANEKCYLFRFYDENKNLVCSKVGTTTRKVVQRLKEELRTKTYADCRFAIIDRVYDCGDIPAEGLESRIRAEYIKKYPNSFKKNDRFINTYFDLKEIDKIVKEYFD